MSNQTPTGIQADIVIANILAGPLTELAPLINSLTANLGQLALSGIIESQAEQLNTHYQQWFEMDDTVIEQSWVRLSGRKRQP